MLFLRCEEQMLGRMCLFLELVYSDQPTLALLCDLLSPYRGIFVEQPRNLIITIALILALIG